MPRQSSATRAARRRASYAGPNVEFYNSALVNNSHPTEWEKDEEGVWKRGSATSTSSPISSGDSGTNLTSLFSPLEAPGGLDGLAIHDNTNPTSLSSVLGEQDRYRSSSPETDGTLSARQTPSPPPLSTSDAIVGIGDVVFSGRHPRRGQLRLEDTNDQFERQFVDYRRELAAGTLPSFILPVITLIAQHHSYMDTPF